ncbi:MAG: hypothetical protein ACRD47_01600 [Nitrososphaeraceae archaeon]
MENYEIVNMSSFPPQCYYCNSKDFGSVDGYERHVVTRHPNLPGYPGPADIKFYRLENQDMYWEREIKADFEWK